jgi:hypothetical protein
MQVPVGIAHSARPLELWKVSRARTDGHALPARFGFVQWIAMVGSGHSA